MSTTVNTVPVEIARELANFMSGKDTEKVDDRYAIGDLAHKLVRNLPGGRMAFQGALNGSYFRHDDLEFALVDSECDEYLRAATNIIEAALSLSAS